MDREEEKEKSRSAITHLSIYNHQYSCPAHSSISRQSGGEAFRDTNSCGQKGKPTRHNTWHVFGSRAMYYWQTHLSSHSHPWQGRDVCVCVCVCEGWEVIHITTRSPERVCLTHEFKSTCREKLTCVTESTYCTHIPVVQHIISQIWPTYWDYCIFCFFLPEPHQRSIITTLTLNI